MKKPLSLITHLQEQIYTRLVEGKVPWDIPNFGVHAINYLTGKPMSDLNLFLLDEGEYIPVSVLSSLGYQVVKPDTKIIMVDFTRGKGPSNPVEIIACHNTTAIPKWDKSVYNEKFIISVLKQMDKLIDKPQKHGDTVFEIISKQLLLNLYHILDMEEECAFEVFETDEIYYEYKIVAGIVTKCLMSMGGLEYIIPNSEEYTTYLKRDDVSCLSSVIYLCTILLNKTLETVGTVEPELLTGQELKSSLESISVTSPAISSNDIILSEWLQRALLGLFTEMDKAFYNKVIVPDSDELYDRILGIVQNCKDYGKIINHIIGDRVPLQLWETIVPEKSTHLKALKPFVLETLFQLSHPDIYNHALILGTLIREEFSKINQKPSDLNTLLNNTEFYALSALIMTENITKEDFISSIPRLSKYLETISPYLYKHQEILREGKGIILDNDTLSLFTQIISQLRVWGAEVDKFAELNPFYKLQFSVKTPKDNDLVKNLVQYISDLFTARGISFDINLEDFISNYTVYYNFNILFKS